jgi:hypothetical protein
MRAGKCGCGVGLQDLYQFSPQRPQGPKILPTAWNFSQGLNMGIAGLGIAQEGLFTFCPGLEFLFSLNAKFNTCVTQCCQYILP